MAYVLKRKNILPNNYEKDFIILTTLVISISCTKKQTGDNDVIIAYTIEDDSLRHAINKFIPQIKDSALIPVLEITPKDIYVYYKIYGENNAFALMRFLTFSLQKQMDVLLL